MKKMFLFGGIVIALLIAIFAVSNMEKKEETTTTTDYYTNKISLDDLRKNIQEKKEQTIYFYKTSCIHCHRVSPIIVPMAKDMNIDMKVIDLENEPGSVWDEFKITGTPTIVHFKEGKEVSRIEGEQPKDNFKKWFTENKK